MNKTSIEPNIHFNEYIDRCRTLIQTNRTDMGALNSTCQAVLEANCPYELYPQQPIIQNNKIKYGALLIHGLFDCPFSLRDIGLSLQARGILSRAILLPGHGTTPNDLLKTSYEQWIQAVQYGVESLRQEVDQIYLIGYSTGTALSLVQTVNDPNIAGIIGIAPAIKIKAPVEIVVGWHRFLSYFGSDKSWVYKDKEIDYAKYRSISFNAIRQVAELTQMNADLFQSKNLQIPILMIMSREDEIVSSHSAIEFFTKLKHPDSEMILYAAKNHHYPDKRITLRSSYYPELHIKHFAHVAIPFAPSNPHYGQQGDYPHASRADLKNVILGAYNRIEVETYERLYRLGLVKHMRQELTYNPDFNFTADKIVNFILRK